MANWVLQFFTLVSFINAQVNFWKDVFKENIKGIKKCRANCVKTETTHGLLLNAQAVRFPHQSGCKAHFLSCSCTLQHRQASTGTARWKEALAGKAQTQKLA